MEDIIVPIFICVVLPVAIVWLVARTKQNETNRKAEIMLKAIESGAQVDMNQFSSPDKRKSPKTLKQELLDKLTGACITTFMGVAFLIWAFVGYFNPGFTEGRFFNHMAPVAGGVLFAIGIGLFISYFVGKKMLAKEIEAEEKKLEQ
jgi:hypothetical protein